jgi:hypothetical protein
MNTYWPVILSGALVVYAIAVRRLQRAAQPLRIELAGKGEWLLSSNYLSKEIKDHVLFLLDSAFGSRLVLLFSILAMPIIAVWLLIYPKPMLDMDKHLHIKDAELKICFDRVATLHDRITLANHPFLFPIFMIWGSIVMLIFTLLYVLFWGSSQWIASSDIIIFIQKKISRRRLA